MLEVVSFEGKLRELIMFCIKSTKLSISWNGEKLTPITFERGLRQGDPLSQYLFVLCTELLGQQIHRAVREGRWKPVKASRTEPGILHIFFTNDLLLFGVVLMNQANIMANIVKDFVVVSGQKIDIQKSKMFLSQNTDSYITGKIQQTWQRVATSDLGLYLGMPLLQGRKSICFNS